MFTRLGTPESPSYLATRGEEGCQQALQQLMYVAKTNGCVNHVKEYLDGLEMDADKEEFERVSEVSTGVCVMEVGNMQHPQLRFAPERHGSLQHAELRFGVMVKSPDDRMHF